MYIYICICIYIYIYVYVYSALELALNRLINGWVANGIYKQKGNHEMAIAFAKCDQFLKKHAVLETVAMDAQEWCKVPALGLALWVSPRRSPRSSYHHRFLPGSISPSYSPARDWWPSTRGNHGTCQEETMACCIMLHCSKKSLQFIISWDIAYIIMDNPIQDIKTPCISQFLLLRFWVVLFPKQPDFWWNSHIFGRVARISLSWWNLSCCCFFNLHDFRWNKHILYGIYIAIYIISIIP